MGGGEGGEGLSSSSFLVVLSNVEINFPEEKPIGPGYTTYQASLDITSYILLVR